MPGLSMVCPRPYFDEAWCERAFTSDTVLDSVVIAQWPRPVEPVTIARFPGKHDPGPVGRTRARGRVRHDARGWLERSSTSARAPSPRTTRAVAGDEAVAGGSARGLQRETVLLHITGGSGSGDRASLISTSVLGDATRAARSRIRGRSRLTPSRASASVGPRRSPIRTKDHTRRCGPCRARSASSRGTDKSRPSMKSHRWPAKQEGRVRRAPRVSSPRICASVRRPASSRRGRNAPFGRDDLGDSSSWSTDEAMAASGRSAVVEVLGGLDVGAS